MRRVLNLIKKFCHTPGKKTCAERNENNLTISYAFRVSLSHSLSKNVRVGPFVDSHELLRDQ